MKRNAVGIADSRNFSGDTLPENSGGVTNAQERETKLAHSIGTYPVVFANSRFHRRKRERERERERKREREREREREKGGDETRVSVSLCPLPFLRSNYFEPTDPCNSSRRYPHSR